MKSLTLLALAFGLFASTPATAGDWVVYPGKAGPGKGKHIVFLAGDEEYRSEEGLPQLAKILSQRHGFKCTVVFSINKETGDIDPNTKDNEPGIEALDSADLCVMLLRFREWPDAEMKHFVDYYLAGKPIIALRTSTHAFNYGKSESPYKKYSYNSREWKGGFGKQVLGETWVSHWAKHKVEATRGVFEASAKSDPLFSGVTEIFGDTDVYEAYPPSDAKILVRGQALKGMKPDDAPADYEKKRATDKESQGINDPMMPVVWVRHYQNEAGKTNEILNTTMGSATDLQDEGLRRLIVNAAYQFTGLKIPAKANVDLVGEFKPTFYGFNGGKKGVKPADLELK